MSAELLPLPDADGTITLVLGAAVFVYDGWRQASMESFARANIAKVEAERDALEQKAMVLKGAHDALLARAERAEAERDAARAEVAAMREAVRGLESRVRGNAVEYSNARKWDAFGDGKAAAYDWCADELATITDNTK